MAVVTYAQVDVYEYGRWTASACAGVVLLEICTGERPPRLGNKFPSSRYAYAMLICRVRP